MSLIFKMNLLKRISKGYGSVKGIPAFNSGYNVIGHYDHMDVTEVYNLTEAFRYQWSQKRNGQRFLNHSIFLCDLMSNNKEDNIFLNSNISQNKTLLICALKLSTSGSVLNNMQSFDNTKGIVIEKLQSALQDFNPHYSNKDDTSSDYFNLYSCLGSFDFILIVASDRIDRMWDVPRQVRGIKIEDHSCRKSERCQTPIFQSSNSFFAVNVSSSLEHAGNEKVDALLRLKLSDIEKYTECEKLLNAYFGGANKNPTYTHGEYDVSFALQKVALRDLIGLRDIIVFPEESRRKLNEKIVEFQKNHVSSSYIRISNEFSMNPMKSGNDGLNDDEYKEVHNGDSDKYCNCDNQENSEDFSKRKAKMLDSLSDLANEAVTYIPVSAMRSFKLLLDKCGDLIETDYRFITGLRIYYILNELMRTICRGKFSYAGRAILSCLGNISFTMNLSMQADNINLDNFDGYDSETVNHLTKMMFAYENMLKIAFQSLTSKNDDTLLFLTINPTEMMNSELYFPGSIKPTNENESIKWKQIININLTSVRYYDAKRSFPYLMHELGHYIYADSVTREARNKVFFSLLSKYTNECVREEVKRIGKHDFDEEIYSKTMRCLLDSIEENIKFAWNYNLPSRAFIVQCKNYNQAVLDLLEPFLVDTIGELRDAKALRLVVSILGAYRGIFERKEHYSMFATMIREAKADMIMYVACCLTPEEYVKVHYDYLNQNKLLGMVEKSYYLRMAAVLKAVGHNPYEYNLGLSRREYEVYALCNAAMLDYDFLLQDLVIYLKDIKASIEDRISLLEDKDNLSDDAQNWRNVRDYFKYPQVLDTDRVLDILMNQWYDSLRSWRNVFHEESKEEK